MLEHRLMLIDGQLKRLESHPKAIKIPHTREPVEFIRRILEGQLDPPQGSK